MPLRMQGRQLHLLAVDLLELTGLELLPHMGAGQVVIVRRFARRCGPVGGAVVGQDVRKATGLFQPLLRCLEMTAIAPVLAPGVHEAEGAVRAVIAGADHCVPTALGKVVDRVPFPRVGLLPLSGEATLYELGRGGETNEDGTAFSQVIAPLFEVRIAQSDRRGDVCRYGLQDHLVVDPLHATRQGGVIRQVLHGTGSGEHRHLHHPLDVGPVVAKGDVDLAGYHIGLLHEVVQVGRAEGGRAIHGIPGLVRDVVPAVLSVAHQAIAQRPGHT